MHLSRRTLLLSGGGVAVAGAGTAGTLVEYDVLPGRSRVHRMLGLTGKAGVIPDVVPGRRAEGVLPSEFMAEDPHFVITYPPKVRVGSRLPVVLALHGAGRTAEAWFDELGIDEFLAASTYRFAIAAVDGGLRSFWHERTDGTDPARMLVEEFVPALEERGLLLSGLLGWSMGGLGALSIAQRLEQPVPVCAVSPALWPEYGQAMQSAFDTREQYDDVMGLVREELDSGEVRIDCGTADPFYRDVMRVVPQDVEQHYSAGDHNSAYWTRVLPDELTWLASKI